MKKYLYLILTLLVPLAGYGQQPELVPQNDAVRGLAAFSPEKLKGKSHKEGWVYTASDYERAGDNLRKTFYLSVDNPGNYFFAAHVMGIADVPAENTVSNKQYPLKQVAVYLDDEYLGELDIRKDGWHPATLKGNKQVGLTAGDHTISFESTAPHYPEVDVIKVSDRPDKATFDMSKYNTYLSELKDNGLKNVGKAFKAEPPTEGTAGEDPFSVEMSASNSGYTHEVNSYVLSNPLGNYKHLMNLPVVYTYYKKLSLSSGQNVTFHTSPISGQDYYSVDPVMYLFHATDINVAWSNDDYTNLHPRISVSIPKSGDYYLVLRAYNNSYANDQLGRQGLVQLYQNGSLLTSEAVISGYHVSVGTSNTGILNYFTAYSTGNPKLWLAPDGYTSPIKFYGNRFWYVSPMDHQWYDDARFRIQKNTSSYQNMYLLVSAEGAWYVYWGNADAYGSVKQGSSTVRSFFPNLKENDAMQTAPSTNTYNCAAWAGGMTNGWFWGCLYPSNAGGSCASGTYYGSAQSWNTWDNFFGNSPMRYSGAVTYTRTSANTSNAEVAGWAKSNGEITHFSVTREANKHPHGYAWESKPGGLERIFHPRDALNSTSYGSIVYYYRDQAKDPYQPWEAAPRGDDVTAQRGINISAEPVFTMEESVRLGLTVLPDVALSQAEATVLSELSARYVTEEGETEALYNEWLAACNANELKPNSNPYKFFELPEAEKLRAHFYANEEPATAFLMQRLFDADENSFEAQVGGMFFSGLTGQKYNELMDEVKEEWQQNSYTDEGAYVAPLATANTRNYIKKILEKRYLGEEEKSAPASVIPDNNELFMVYPNPVYTISEISLNLQKASVITLTLYDVNGRMVKEYAVNESYLPGQYSFAVNRSEYDAGMYVATLNIEGKTFQRKILVR
ncbi:T9SS type A sorting domain-containing protein [Roseivirga sp. BDSF3-8]|uniref:T9SS type A sorting domain-containing protein n=1 Tax=Roseivirga sp. BDSF3-8 TaxID=3241598 RepID=UPI003531820B